VTSLQAEQALLELYQSAAGITLRMLEAARREDWEALISGGDSQNSVMAELAAKDVFVWESEPLIKQKSELISTILSANQEIATLTRAWTGELDGLLASITTAKKLGKAYEPR
jgi:hypothetical protein